MKKLLPILCLFAFSITTNAQYTITIEDVDFDETIGEITDCTSTQKDIIIPDNFDNVDVTSIGNSAFRSNQLESVTIPNSVTSIGEKAFRKNQLKTVTIPNSVTSIGEKAFYYNDLTSVTIGNSVTTIGYGAFRSNELTSVVIPKSVTSIGQYAFRENQLATVTIPNSVTFIGDYAFRNNELTSVVIPNSVTTIGAGAFNNNGLDKFNLPANYQGSVYQWTDEEGVTYKSGDAVTDLETSYTLDEGVIANISTMENENIFNFYPNPSSDFIHSDLEVTTLTISNSQGIIVNQFGSNNTEYNVSNLEAGVYFIEAIGTDGATYTSKLIKE